MLPEKYKNVHYPPCCPCIVQSNPHFLSPHRTKRPGITFCQQPWSPLSWVNKWMKIKISCCSIHTCEILILFSLRWNTLSVLLSLLCRATSINIPAVPREKCKWLKGTTNYIHSAHAQVWVPSLWWNLDVMTFVNRLVTNSQPFERRKMSDSFQFDHQKNKSNMELLLWNTFILIWSLYILNFTPGIKLWVQLGLISIQR